MLNSAYNCKQPLFEFVDPGWFVLYGYLEELGSLAIIKYPSPGIISIYDPTSESYFEGEAYCKTPGPYYRSPFQTKEKEMDCRACLTWMISFARGPCSRYMGAEVDAFGCSLTYQYSRTHLAPPSRGEICNPE